MNPFFGWKLDLNWTGILNRRTPRSRGRQRVLHDHLRHDVLQGGAREPRRPAPNYDMQRILATRNPREAR
jgi:SSS family solute:Na+ symporter